MTNSKRLTMAKTMAKNRCLATSENCKLASQLRKNRCLPSLLDQFLSRNLPSTVTLLNRYDEERNKLEPNQYQIHHNGVTVHIGVVFGDICRYDDGTNVWFNTTRGKLNDEWRQIADRTIVDLHEELNVS